MSYTVFIPSAGIGSRLGPHTKLINKALITLGDLPVIVRIIKKFPPDIEFVIALGYCGSQIRQAVETLCPEYKVIFVNVSKFQGDGAGLGLTLSECKPYLQKPFIFTTNDTIVDIDVDELSPVGRGNWAGFYQKRTGDKVPTEQYRTINIYDGKVTQFNPKGVDSKNIYIGLAGVKDYATFWSHFDSTSNVSSGEVVALNQMMDVEAIEFQSWQDIGNLASLQSATKKFKNPNYNILEKESEAIWFEGDRVTKFHVDSSFISDRIKRLAVLPPDLFPSISHSTQNTYTYKKVKGEIFASVVTPRLVKRLLDTVFDRLWSKAAPDDFKKELILTDFYQTKTLSRVDHYFSRFEKSDMALCINDVHIPPAETLMQEVPWRDLVQKSRFAEFHGDFHSENILIREDGAFCFLDWRQNFGDKNYLYGDTYYDLAKFLHGLLVNHHQIEKENFTVRKIGFNHVYIDVHVNYNNFKSVDVLRQWCTVNGYDFENVQLITGLIYLNICGLHEYPYSEFLFYLGMLMVFENVEK